MAVEMEQECAPGRTEHCWHPHSTDETTLPPTTTWVCCWCPCSSTREWDRPKGHGKYLPAKEYPHA